MEGRFVVHMGCRPFARDSTGYVDLEPAMTLSPPIVKPRFMDHYQRQKCELVPFQLGSPNSCDSLGVQSAAGETFELPG